MSVTTQLPRRTVATALDLRQSGTAERVISVHYPTVEPDGRIMCRACGAPGFCETWRRQALAQLGTAERIWAQVTLLYLRAVTHPALEKRVPHEVNETFFGWITGAVEAQKALDRARERAVIAVTTGAQRAVGRITTWASNRALSMLTPRRGRHRVPEKVG